MARSNTEKRISAYILSRISLVVAVALLAVGIALSVAGNYAKTQVRTELSAQNIYFPKKDSESFSPKEYPDLQKYAGQKVDDGIKARAYANGYIGRHLKKIGGGKTYAEVSAAQMADPTNAKLAQQKQSLFQGETLRGILLGNGYGYWMMGVIAQIAALVCYAAMVVLGAYGYVQLMRARR